MARTNDDEAEWQRIDGTPMRERSMCDQTQDAVLESLLRELPRARKSTCSHDECKVNT